MDGSYIEKLDEDRCSGFWLLIWEDGAILLSSSTFLCSASANAYVGELLGLLGSLLTLRFLFSTCTDNLLHPISLHSDCLRALKRLLQHRQRIKNKTDHCGIIWGITNELKLSAVQISAKYVSTHQDNLRQWFDLSLLEKANCTCDELVKHTLWGEIASRDNPPPLPLRMWNLSIDNFILYNDINHSIRKALSRKMFVPYMSKLGLQQSMFDQISWKLLGETLHMFLEPFQLWYSKHISNFCGIGSYMVYMKK